MLAFQLEILDLSNNALFNMFPYSELPNKSPRLSKLNLSHNRVSSFTIHIFIGMISRFTTEAETVRLFLRHRNEKIVNIFFLNFETRISIFAHGLF